MRGIGDVLVAEVFPVPEEQLVAVPFNRLHCPLTKVHRIWWPRLNRRRSIW